MTNDFERVNFWANEVNIPLTEEEKQLIANTKKDLPKKVEALKEEPVVDQSITYI